MAHLRAAAAPTHAPTGMRAKGPMTGQPADAGLVYWSNPAVNHRGEAQRSSGELRAGCRTEMWRNIHHPAESGDEDQAWRLPLTLSD
ncbi:hypothetical protein D4764_16G0007130 [Takifugu flavidus]|uniref:Uncharacterized protein n=1 Tax=Takifugu flavidus TaxID=433684 RepID=A0A5C6NZE6_9TELE|nr:hypothetical protein D4764_16G0007130 [Takifugu flavidus]